MSAIMHAFQAGRRLDHVEVIDMHCHAGQYNGLYVPLSTPAAFVEYMDRYGVDLSCISAAPPGAPGDVRLINDRLIAFKRAVPERFGVYVTLNTNQLDTMIDEIERVRAQVPIVGVKMHVYDQPHTIGEKRFDRLLEYLERNRLAVLHHDFGEGLAERCREFPGVVFLEGHWLHTELAAALPNLYVSFCGEFRPGVLSAEVLARVPAEKIVFGSDMNLLDAGVNLAHVACADIPEEAKVKILGSNMRAILDRLAA
jgi:predicted TIM-barrel fold metal-dependent hydrolase